MDATSDAGPRERLLFALKTRGPLTTAALARRLDRTEVAVRQQLARLEEEGLVRGEDERRPVGRPRRVWHLTREAAGRFPDGHADLTVELLGDLRSTLGPRALARLVAARTARQLELYRQRLPREASLGRRVGALARLRREEGYMAEHHRRADGFELIENHCPICAAAEVCQGLCEGELELFRELFGPGVEVERTEHLLAGARRCAYRIRPVR